MDRGGELEEWKRRNLELSTRVKCAWALVKSACTVKLLFLIVCTVLSFIFPAHGSYIANFGKVVLILS